MRVLLLAVPLLLVAAPAAAEPAAPLSIPPALSDPAVADQLGRVAGVLAKSLMNLPVGEMEAAIEGRAATPSDKAITVGDRLADPELEQRVATGAAASGRAMQAATKALVASLPAIMKSLEGAEAALEKAVANLPDPTYPRR